MNELVQLIVSRTGISESQARSAIDVVISHLKGRLPESLASHVDNLVNSEASTNSGSDLGALGGLFGGKKSA